jgi:hypothetical protein|tara:strand:+ start:73 stop:507 length:435 start_codon:yes stop_codon:yes gene_type:complete
MKKLLYTFLAVSIIFAACKKEEDEVVTPVAPSIVGVWTPTSAAVNYNVTMGGMMLMDTSYTMTPTDEEWDLTDVEFTADGQRIMDGESIPYSHSGNTLTITEDNEIETHTCTVTSTDMVLIMNDTEVEDGMIITSDITLNLTRQ